MKHAVLLLLLSFTVLSLKAQTLIVPENDSTFVMEYRDGDEWGFIAKNGFAVGLSNIVVKDDYGTFYQIHVLVENMTESNYLFDPDSISATITNQYVTDSPLKVYSAEGFQKKIKREQALTSAFTGLAAGFSNSYNGYNSYNSYNNFNTYMQLSAMDKQMEYDRKIRDEGYLRKNTIHPGEGIVGYMNIKRIKGQTVKVTIPVKGTDYVFTWDVSKKKKTKREN